MSNTNFISPQPTVTETDIRNLEKAKKYERKKATEGWRWVRVNERLCIFVPCDKQGVPTEEGLEKIRKQKLRLNIK